MKKKALTPLLIAAVTIMIIAVACTKIDDSSKPNTSTTTTKAAATTKAETSAGTTAVTTPRVTTEAGTVVPVLGTVGSNLTLEEIGALSTKAQGWGPGTQSGEDKRPYGALSAQEKYGKYDAYYIAEADGRIFLTFDEGYENGYTPSILDTLKEKEVKAVFFVTQDYVKRNADLVQRMIDEGHIVGNHSWTHPASPNSLPTLSMEQVEKEIMQLHNYVKEHFNYTMTLFRPPEGAFSEQTLALTQKLGYKSVFWSFAYKDWDVKNQIGSDAAYKKVTGSMHDGGIFLLHAVSKDNAAILPAVIDAFQAAGYSLEAFQ